MGRRFTAADAVVPPDITVGNTPSGGEVTPDGSKVYVGNAADGTGPGSPSVSVIDTATDTVTATFPHPVTMKGLAVSADGTTLYVANQVRLPFPTSRCR